MLDILKELPRDSFRLIVDSGAFTAWNIGKSITLDDYCRFLDRIIPAIQPDHVVQLDVFGEPEKTWENFLTMERRGYKVMPVFTRGDSVERLDEMYTKTDYIMFGGIVIGGQNIEYCKWFNRVNKGRKAHWLGFTKTDFMKAWRPYSADASSWNGAMRFGGVVMYEGAGNITKYSRSDFTPKNLPSIYRSAALCGITPSDLSLLRSDDAWIDYGGDKFLKNSNNRAGFFSTIAHIKRAVEIEKNIKTKIYLAASTRNHLLYINAAYKFLMERKAL